MPVPVLHSFSPILVAALTIALLHASIPTHWLPFVLVGRAQGWSHARTLTVTALAGAGHVLMTTALGLGVVWFGLKLDSLWGNAFPWVAGGVLIGTGIFYLARHALARGIHTHACGHAHPDEKVAHRKDWAALSGLFAMLALSPCETFLPVYLSSAQYGWRGFLLLSAMLAAGTWLAMVLFTWLTLKGIARLDLAWLEKYEPLVLGSVLCTLGVLVVVIEHLDH